MLVYKVTNLINNECYIGATTNYMQRIKIHKSSMKKHLYPIAIALVKYGWENFAFTVLECEPNKETMYEREQYYVKFYDSMNNGYNGTSGGLNCKRSKEFVNSGKNHQFYRKKHTENTKQKMRDNHADFTGENNPNYKGKT